MDANKRFINSIVRKHNLALGFVFALVLLNLVAFQLTTKYQKDDRKLLNVAGQQSMLTQKITLHIERLANQTDLIERNSQLKTLEQAINVFEKNHNFLIQTAPLNSASVPHSAYFSGTPTINDMVLQFIFWSRRALEFGVVATQSEMTPLRIELMLSRLGMVESSYEENAQHRVDQLEWLMRVTSLAIILTLLLKLKYIFIPFQKRINQTIKQLSNERSLANELQKKADDANEAKSLFMTNMSHELRTPLNGIFGMLDLAIEQKGTLAKDDLIRKAKRSGNQLLRIVTDILDISTIEAREQKLDLANFSTTHVFDECIAPISIISDQKHIRLDVEISGMIPEYLYGAGNKLRQILNNLLNNAVKYTDVGVISFKATSEEQFDSILLFVEISDTGIGMTKEQQKSVFKPFRQADSGVTRKYSGTGLGLSIVSELVKLMDGHLQLHSEYGKGSTFTLKLPFKVANMPSEREREVALYASQYDLSHKKVAVVDDLAISRKFITHQLNVLKVDADIFSSGEALLASDINQYDLFIIDLNMPGMDGDEVAKNLKPKLSPLKNQKLILISASEDNLEDHQIHDTKFDYHFSKPIEESRFFDALVAALLPNAAAHDPRKFNILIAEDNDINAHVAKQHLVSMGYNVTRVSDGQQAIEICNDPDSKFDLILMDINMPKVDGYQATNIIRGSLGLTIPIIALTANAFETDVEKSMSAGMNKHLVKPLQKSKLQQVVKSCLGEAVTPE